MSPATWMIGPAMEPFGRSLLAFADGDESAQVVLERDDGRRATLPAGWFFRDPRAFTAIESKALALCRGRVLDAGAGAGSLSLELQRRSHRVTALDISPHAATVCLRRGVGDVVCADVLTYEGGPFDTLLLMGHGVGMVGSVYGLDRFLSQAHSLVALGGQIILDSLDVRVTDDPANLAYHHARREAGAYIGEIRMRFEFAGNAGPWSEWLQVDADMLVERAGAAGWTCGVVLREASGDYLARLTRRT